MSDDSPPEFDYIDLENGHYSEHSESEESRSGSDTEAEEESATTEGVFDKNLPTTHKYLGRLDYISRYTLYDDGQLLESVIGIHTNTLVFPGFTLPLILNVHYEYADIVDNMKNGCTFVLVCLDKRTGLPFNYGVIMEIFESSYKRGTLFLKAKGRQRCKIISRHDSRPAWSRVFTVTVKVLGEPNVQSPVKNTDLRALSQKRSTSVADYELIQKYYKHRKYHLAQYSVPSWICDHNELCFFVKHIVEGLSRFYERGSVPRDPLLLSYWFAQNFQLAYEERLEILTCNNVWERLRIELKFLKLERLICCMTCKVDVGRQKDVFAMSKDGVQSNYCNPGGQVYETVTILEAKNYKLVGAPSKQFSWFPGYYWIVMQCQRCRTHLGWQFTSKYLQPPKFFGLANSGIDILINETRPEDP